MHGNLKVASNRKTTWSRHSDGGPEILLGVVVDKNVEVGRSVPNAAAEVIAVLKWESAGAGRVGEDDELLLLVWLVWLDPDVAAAAECVGPEVFLVLGG